MARTWMMLTLILMAVSTPCSRLFAQWPGTQRCDSLLQQQPMNACYAEVAQRTTAKLDTLVRQLLQRLAPSRRAGLQASQAAWIKYRDLECRWEEDAVDGGTVGPLIGGTCMIDLTWKRIDELKLHLCDDEGMSGACTESKRYDRRKP